MLTTIDYVNNYDKFKEDFTKDTGNEYTSGSVAYTMYYHARIADMHYQLTFQVANRLLNEIDNLPNKTGIRIEESIKEFLNNQK